MRQVVTKKGSPCLSPLFGKKLFIMLPFHKREMLVEEIPFIIKAKITPRKLNN